MTRRSAVGSVADARPRAGRPPDTPPAADLTRSDPGRRLLRWLAGGAVERVPAAMIVAAHPDDEVIGAGAQLARLPGLRVVQVTDGAPRDGRDAAAAGFDTWQAYASARGGELDAALRRAGLPAGTAQGLGLPDQGAAFRLAGLARTLAAIFQARRPEVVIAQPYEGGHPDHDAAACAVQAACALLVRRGRQPPARVEMTAYHAADGGLATGRFLPWPGCEVTMLVLDAAARARKRALVACFASQRRVLAQFPLELERFRPAPRYDFARPPHAGRLFYEHFDWGVDGPGWRELARAALAELDLGATP